MIDRNNVKMARDIVQFVPLRQFKTQGANFSLVCVCYYLYYTVMFVVLYFVSVFKVVQFVVK